jgi:hypothetical protein
VRRNTVQGKLYLWIVFFVLLGFSSCKTARVATTSRLSTISTSKLIRNIENNAFDYKYLFVKRINCLFDNGNTQTSFRASIQAEKDKQVTVLLTKMNFPVARIWLTPDSVKFINYLENSYMLGDYRNLSKMLGMELDFQTVNAIISNNVFSMDDDDRDYETTIDSGMYVLESVKNMEVLKTNQKMREPARQSKKLAGETTVKQSLYIDPLTYKLRKIRLDDAVNSRFLKVEFSDFVNVDKQLYPGDIFLHFLSPENNIQLSLKLSNFSTEKEKEIRFRVPEKFTQTGHE